MVKMYISGGFTDGHFSDAMLCYNPKHDIWERRTPMQNPRGWHQMVTVKGQGHILSGFRFRLIPTYSDLLKR